MSTKVAVYFRCSTDQQDKSIEDQRTVLIKYAQTYGMEIVAWFDKDEGKSGTSFLKRPDFMRMVRLVESGHHNFAQIIVYDVDRWGRPLDPDESVYWEQHFKRQGVQVRYASDESINDDTLAGRLTKKIKQELATEESRKQSVRVRERSKMRAAEGFRVGGFAPYGYKRLLLEADGTPIRVLEHGERKFEKTQRVALTPGDSDEVIIVKRMFKMRLAGHGARYIANTFNSEELPSPGIKRKHGKAGPGKWSQSSVASILSNPVYIGRWTYNKQVRGSWAQKDTPGVKIRPKSDQVVVDHAHEALVSEIEFESAQARITHRHSGRPVGRGMSSDYLLSGLIVCEHCGYNYHGHKKVNGSGKTYRYYEDSGYALRGDSVCSQSSVPAETLEQFIVDALDRNLSKIVDKTRLRKLIASRVATFSSQDDRRGKSIQKELADVKSRLSSLAAAVESGANFEPILERMKQLTDRKQRLESDLGSAGREKLPHLDTDQLIDEIANYADNALDLIRSSNPVQAKLGLRKFLDRVEIDPRTKTATFLVYKIPRISAAYNEVVSVKTCRRSESNRHDVAIGGF